MPRPRQRVCLESGLKFDLNRLARQGFVRPGARTGPTSICWTNTYTGEHVASGEISANMENPGAGFFAFKLDRSTNVSSSDRRSGILAECSGISNAQ